MFVSITEASRLVNKATVTLYRHIKKGKLSRGSDGMIDTADLLRVYGALSNDNVTSSVSSNDTDTTVVTALLQEQIAELKQRMDEANKREGRLMALLESRLLMHDSKATLPTEGLVSKLKKLF